MGFPNITPPDLEVTPQWQSYLDLENDVLPWLQITSTEFNSFPSWKQTQLRDTVDSLCWAVQDYLARPIAPTLFFRRFNGWANFTGAYISLPYYPVLAVNYVTEWWGSNGPQNLTLMTPENQGSQNVYQLDAVRGIVTRAFTGLVQRPFFPGSQNIEIEWVAGYNPVPRDLVMMTKDLIKEWWVNTQDASRSVQMPSEYGGMMETNPQMWPGLSRRVSQIFSPYASVGIG